MNEMLFCFLSFSFLKLWLSEISAILKSKQFWWAFAMWTSLDAALNLAGSSSWLPSVCLLFEL